MHVWLIVVPYDSGQRAVRMGAGPLKLALAADRLRARGTEVTVTTVEAPAGFRTEVGTTFALHRSVAAEAGEAIANGAFPIVLSGNCSGSIGAFAAAGAGTGIAWFDGHGDFNTPETTVSGFLDGMALAVATGRCFGTLARSIPRFAPVAERDAFLVGSRHLDPGERDALTKSDVGWVTVASIRERGPAAALEPALRRVRARRLHLHVDLDVHDPALAPANEFAPRDGLTREEVQASVRAIAAARPICSASFAAYDPAVDPSGKCLEAGLQLIELVSGLGSG
ncbi:MAG TPA: arginase family protein [Myxococcales bacterium]|nr:arginase family protein [Myxococcales bacterium]